MDCACYDSLLPLAAVGLLDETQRAVVRAHIVCCAHYQDEMALHERLDGALRRVVDGEAKDTVLFSREEMLHMRERVDGVATAGGVSGAKARRAQRVRSGVFIGIPALAAVLLLTLLAGVVFHLGGRRGGGDALPKQTPLPSTIDLYSVSMVSAAEGWAVGGTKPDLSYSPVQDGTPRPNYIDPVLAHYHDGAWQIVALPAAVQTLSHHGLSIVLYGISMVSAEEGWAVGGSVIPPNAEGMTVGVLLHYTHGTWTLAAGGTSDTPVFSIVRMRNATDGWAAGGSAVYHFDGREWQQVKDAALKNVSVATLALAPDGGIWAEGVDYGFTGGSGFDGDAPSTFLHFDGSRWTRVASPLPHARITSMAMASASEGWAVGVLPPLTRGGGSADASKPYGALILHYVNGAWQEQARFREPVGSSGRTLYTFHRVLVTPDGQDWAVGSMGLLARYARAGWMLLPSIGNAELHDVAFVSPSEGWAVGERGMVLHDVRGVWTVYGA